MKRVYATFGGKAYDETIRLIVTNAPKCGVDKVLVYDDRWLIEKHAEFMNKNAWLWQTERDPHFKKNFGFGWCCWKALVILDAISQGHLDDMILYTDADTYPVADLSPVFEMPEDVILFEAQGCTNRMFTRRDTFRVMGVPDTEDNGDRILACGRFSAFRVTGRSFEFVTDWLRWSACYDCQRLDPSSLGPEWPEFTRHSNEQSVLSVLAIKYGITPHREACQFGWPIDREYFARRGLIADEYPQLFIQRYCKGDRTDYSGSAFRNV